MSKKEELTSQDLVAIEAFNKEYGRVFETLEKARQLSVGDFLVLYLGDDEKSMKLELNSYGAPVKYKVVHMSEHGVPFLKKVNKKGTPIGQLLSYIDNFHDHYETDCFEYRLDPDFADAILLEDEYDPAQLHKNKQELFKSITKHNKQIKIKTQEIKDISIFFASINIGDTLWSSNSNYVLVYNKKTMSAYEFNSKAKWNEQTSMRGSSITVLAVKDKNGKIKEITADYFLYKALYKERPRTYKELKI
jgi:hypothetical protein